MNEHKFGVYMTSFAAHATEWGGEGGGGADQRVLINIVLGNVEELCVKEERKNFDDGIDHQGGVIFSE